MHPVSKNNEKKKKNQIEKIISKSDLFHSLNPNKSQIHKSTPTKQTGFRLRIWTLIALHLGAHTA